MHRRPWAILVAALLAYAARRAIIMGIFKNDDQKSSQFGFDEKSMAGKAVKAVRWIYAITGVLALIAGIALLFAPAKSLVFLTTVLGFLLCNHCCH